MSVTWQPEVVSHPLFLVVKLVWSPTSLHPSQECLRNVFVVETWQNLVVATEKRHFSSVPYSLKKDVRNSFLCETITHLLRDGGFIRRSMEMEKSVQNKEQSVVGVTSSVTSGECNTNDGLVNTEQTHLGLASVKPQESLSLIPSMGY